MSTTDSGRGRTVALSLWLLVILSLGTYRYRSPGELFDAGGIDWEIKIQIGCWFFLGLVAFIAVLKGRVDRGRLRGPLLWFTVWLLLGVGSAAYSPAPSYTLFRAFQLATALCLVLAADVDHELLYRAIALFLAINLVVGLPELAVAAGTIGPGGLARLGTRFGHPSILGTAAATGAAGLFARWADRGLTQWEWLGLGVFCFTTLIAINRTAIAALIGAILMVSVLRRRLSVLVAVGVVLFCLVSFEAYTGGVSHFLSRGQSAFEIRSLTSRLDTWQAVIERIRGGGLVGEGLGATRFLPATQTIGLGHAHNIYLEAMVWLGIPGVAVITLLLFSWARRQLLAHRWGFGRWSFHLVDIENLAMLLPLVAFCVTDLGFIALINPLLFVYLAAMRLTVDRYEEMARNVSESHVQVRQRRSTRGIGWTTPPRSSVRDPSLSAGPPRLRAPRR